MAFSPDNRTLVTGGRLGQVGFWDPATGRKLAAPAAGHADVVVDLAFSPDGTLVASASTDGSLIFWDLRPATWETRACALAGRNLTRPEWDRFVGGDYRGTCPQWPEG